MSILKLKSIGARPSIEVNNPKPEFGWGCFDLWASTQRSLHCVNYKQVVLEKMPRIIQAWKITATGYYLPFDTPGKRSKHQNADYYPGSYSQAGRNRSRFTHVEANTCQPIS